MPQAKNNKHNQTDRAKIKTTKKKSDKVVNMSKQTKKK
jgi:hypothetical protein